MVGAQRVRLWGIDAPEGRQTCKDAQGRAYACGDVARDQLRSLIGAERVTCEAVDLDPYGRTVARCQAGATELGPTMVRSGWAIDYSEYSGGAYAVVEQGARATRRGLWQGAFERPSAWRAHERPGSATQSHFGPVASSPPTGCAIKGNINDAGQRIFHRPGQRDYAATRINPGRGERWFCSAAEAEAAGWRAARR